MFGSPKSNSEISIILKRQVPIRYNEPSNSWLGGLPKMPESVLWPRSEDGTALQFVAQVHCADFPPKLWNGHGPRKGWLLLFVDVLSMEDVSFGGNLQVLRIKELGPEREPPEDAPTVRHAMSDYIDFDKPAIRPGVHKMWRRWPVDLVVQQYDLDNNPGPPNISGDDLYNAPASIWDAPRIGAEPQKPLTWRGALYLVESALRRFEPEEFKKRWTGDMGGLFEPPEPDRDEFKERLNERLEERKDEFAEHVIPGYGIAWASSGAVEKRKAIEAELAKERELDWIDRAFRAHEKSRLRCVGLVEDLRKKLDEQSSDMSPAERESTEGGLNYRRTELEGLKADHAYLSDLFAQYRGREAELNMEIRQSGEAYLAWGKARSVVLEEWHRYLLSQDLDAALPDAEWERLEAELRSQSNEYWCRVSSPRLMVKTRSELFSKSDLEMAVREDVLDLYTRSADSRASLPVSILEDIEPKLRHVDIAHRLGGQRTQIQNDHEGGSILLFQLSSDPAMGWMWGDLGALNVNVSLLQLLLGRYRRPHGWIESH